MRGKLHLEKNINKNSKPSRTKIMLSSGRKDKIQRYTQIHKKAVQNQFHNGGDS